MTLVALGLGANLGEARRTLADAVRELDASDEITLLGVSGLWRTAPQGGPEQPDYLNAVVALSTDLSPQDVLALTQDIEQAAGRTREVRWGPRTLDIDVLDVMGQVSADPVLTLPHPRAHERAFVLGPWAQVQPGWVLTPAGRDPAPVRQWWARVADDPEQAVVPMEGDDWWR